MRLLIDNSGKVKTIIGMPKQDYPNIMNVKRGN